MAQSYQDLVKRLQGQQPQVQAAPQVQPTSTANATQIQYQQAPNAPRAQLRGAADLARQYGNIDYDEDSIYDVFRQDVDARHDALQASYDRSANDYYNRLGNTQQMMQDTLSQERMTSGASAGMQSANQLSAMLGLTGQTTQDATELTREQRGLMDQRTADEAQARLNAMQTADQRRQFLAQLDAQLHASDTQHAIGQMAAEGQVSAANVAASAQGRTADLQHAATLDNARYNYAGQTHTADQNLRAQNFGTLGSAASYGYSADQNLRGTDMTSARNLQGTRYAADQNLAGTRYSSDQALAGNRAIAGAQVRASENQAAASRHAANVGYDAQVLGYQSAEAQTAINAMGGIAQSWGASGNFNAAEIDQVLNAWFDMPELNQIKQQQTSSGTTTRPGSRQAV